MTGCFGAGSKKPLPHGRGAGFDLPGQPLAVLDDEFDGRAFLPIDLDFGEGWDADEIDSIGCHETTRNGDGFDR